MHNRGVSPSGKGVITPIKNNGARVSISPQINFWGLIDTLDNLLVPKLIFGD